MSVDASKSVTPLIGLAGIAGGAVASLGMFAMGTAFAVWFLASEPAGEPFYSADVTDLWSSTPRHVDLADQHLERLPARQAEPFASPTQARLAEGQPSFETVSTGLDMADRVDPITTSSLATDDADMPAGLSPLHEQWCADHYRSYRPHDDSYTSYGGEVRRCVSPFSGAGDAEPLAVDAVPGDDLIVEDAVDVRAYVEEDEFLGAPVQRFVAHDEPASIRYALDTGGGWNASEHIASCFDRYRSYRPGDNSYQPYGGGPRRQCH
ncbi:BA14K family protein [Mesorhizobium marinum]|uniref:BA14K family protein n=1 Tax=Mesorhizobium marinum TaxID=3228790 RepID=UPI0034666421